MFWNVQRRNKNHRAFLPMVLFTMDQEGLRDFAEIIIEENDGKEALNMGSCYCTGWTTRWSYSQSPAYR
uniref:Uncharacterized protein n=1 Tax=Aotus nancymaae TaxID=37293 RepID=A0A2K5F056_AOTNA